MLDLKGYQKKYLRSKAHALRPVVVVGKNGLTSQVLEKVEASLTEHELIKIRFLEFKKEKKELCVRIESETQSMMAGLIGHVAIFYRPFKDSEKKEIKLPD